MFFFQNLKQILVICYHCTPTPSFVTALREELTEYYRLVAALEASLREGGVTLLQVTIYFSYCVLSCFVLLLLLLVPTTPATPAPRCQYGPGSP